MRGTTPTSIFAALCLAALSAGWSAGADEPKAEATFDTLSAAATSASEIGDKATDERLRTLRVNVGPMPVPVSASNIEYDSDDARLEFDSTSSVQAVAAFYRDSLKPQGWKERPPVINRGNMAVLDFSRGDKQISFTIMQLGPRVNVSAHGSGLTNTRQAAQAPTATRDTNRDTPVAVSVAAQARVTEAAPAEASAKAPLEDLEADETQGLPVPKRHTMTLGDKSPFRTGLTANVPLDLATVLAFYRGELTRRGWTEDVKNAVVKADEATLAFTTPDGPATLKLGRKDGETTVALALRKPVVAEKAGMLPKAGQARLLFGNMLGGEAVVTINKQTVKVAAGAGVKTPEGPKLDLPPGKYTYSLKVANKSAQNEEVEVHADETWGLMIGPGGILPLHMY